MKPGDNIKVVVQLDGSLGYGSESPWAEVTEVWAPADTLNRVIVELTNTCFLTRLAFGDTVMVQENADERWQVIDVIARGPLYTWTVYLTNEAEIAAGVKVDEMRQRERVQLLDHRLTKWMAAEFPNDEWRRPSPPEPRRMFVASGVGIAPVAMVHFDSADLADSINSFEAALHDITDELDLLVDVHTSPDDELGQGIFDDIEFRLITEPTVPDTGSTYDAFSDPYWEVELADFHVTSSQIIRDLVNSLVRTDPRVAADLEAGRYDRVKQLVGRFLLDPNDLPPLDGPIWKD